MAIPSDNPKIVYNSVTLWLPRKFVKWENSVSMNPVITEGLHYVQVVTSPIRYSVKCTTANFTNDTDVWDGTSRTFLAAWDLFQAWAQIGKVFSFYRSATNSTADRKSVV